MRLTEKSKDSKVSCGEGRQECSLLQQNNNYVSAFFGPCLSLTLGVCEWCWILKIRSLVYASSLKSVEHGLEQVGRYVAWCLELKKQG